MAGESTNFGVALKKDTSLIGEVIVLEFPEVSNPQVEITHHTSDGKEFVSGEVVEVGTFKATINFIVTASGILNDVLNGTSGSYSIEFPNSIGIWSFTATPVGFKPLTADSQNPEALKADVTFRPSGNVSLS